MKKMIVSDSLYGEYEIDGVLVELINSEEVQRLKDIHMVGPSYLLNPLWNETRYEHSVGVMLLIRKLGGSLEEQIAGLLHDVSHTIFSHVIDMVMDRSHEDYHEEIKAAYIQTTSIPSILDKYGFDDQQLLLNDAQWKLLEQEAPLLCADRIDYTLREAYRYFDTDLDDIHQFLDSLHVVNDQIVLNQVSAGEWFIEQYYQVVLDLIYDPVNIYGYEWMSKILSVALNKGFLSQAYLMKTENEVLKILTGSKDAELDSLFHEFYKDVSFREVDDTQDFDIHQRKKLRLIDPLVMVDNQICPTSACSTIAKKMTAEAKERSERGIYLRVEP